jgi:cell division septation protein DedD
MDEGFHEIQLSGKQLVFLFMATTVVSVVIFLCGVLVGRGVKGDTVNAAEAPPAAPTATAGTTSTPEPPPTTIEAPPASAPDLSYPTILEGAKSAREGLKEIKPTPEPPPAEPKPAETPATKTVAEPPPPTPAPASKTATPTPVPQGSKSGAWAVQVVALSDRGAANAVVQRLSAKGYKAFVVVPAPTAVQHFKVQVGRFADRSEAEQIRQRLKKEEQFEPIIVR